MISTKKNIYTNKYIIWLVVPSLNQFVLPKKYPCFYQAIWIALSKQEDISPLFLPQRKSASNLPCELSWVTWQLESVRTCNHPISWSGNWKHWQLGNWEEETEYQVGFFKTFLKKSKKLPSFCPWEMSCVTGEPHALRTWKHHISLSALWVIRKKKLRPG